MIIDKQKPKKGLKLRKSFCLYLVKVENYYTYICFTLHIMLIPPELQACLHGHPPKHYLKYDVQQRKRLVTIISKQHSAFCISTLIT